MGTAVAVLDDARVDDFAIALDQVGYQITNGTRARWPMHHEHPLTPSWAVSVRAQEDEVAEGLAAVNPRSVRPALWGT